MSQNLIALVSGLGTFATGMLSATMAFSNRSHPSHVILWGVSAVLFLFAGLEFFHYALSPPSQEYRLFSRSVSCLFIDLIYISLAISLMVGTVGYQSKSTVFCSGRLGAGFPIAFICDNSGESPISDWGIISWSDNPNLVRRDRRHFVLHRSFLVYFVRSV